MRQILALALLVSLLVITESQAQARKNVPRVAARVTFTARSTREPGDMCVWVHPDSDKRNQSIVITSDPKAHAISMFDIEGQVVDALKVPKPGDIDVRYNFPLEKGKAVDIIAVLQRRNGNRVLIFTIDSKTRRLQRLDDNAIFAGTESVGGCLYNNIKTGKFYFFATGHSGTITQIELVSDGMGRISGKRLPKRLQAYSECRGAVADDEHGTLYVSEKSHGVWKYEADPGGAAKGTLIAKIGDNGLYKDIEGLGLYHVAGGHGYLVVCSEGSNRFLVYDREKNNYLGSFLVRGSRNARCVDICAADLGLWYTKGMFLCNTEDRNKRSRIIAVPWESIAGGFFPKMGMFRSWNPRKQGVAPSSRNKSGKRSEKDVKTRKK